MRGCQNCGEYEDEKQTDIKEFISDNSKEYLKAFSIKKENKYVQDVSKLLKTIKKYYGEEVKICDSKDEVIVFGTYEILKGFGILKG
jgi:hypothetical protein